MKNLYILLMLLLACNMYAQSNWELLPPHNLNESSLIKIKSAIKQGIVLKANNEYQKLFDPSTFQWIPIKNDLGIMNDFGILPSGKWIGKINYKMYSSIDNGQNWQLMENYPEFDSRPNLSRTQDNHLFLGGFDKYFISMDEGNSWEEHEAPEFRQLGWFFSMFQKIYTLPDQIVFGDIYELHNYDQANHKLNKIFNEDKLTVRSQNSHMSEHGNIHFSFSVYDELLDKYVLQLLTYESINSEPTLFPLGNNLAYVEFANNGILVGVGNNELFKSNDYGQNWYPINLNLTFPDSPADTNWIKDLAISDDNFVYVQLTNGSIYVNKEILNSPSLSTNETFQSQAIAVFPNPATEYVDFHVTSDLNMIGLQLRIMDLNGKIVHSADDLQGNHSYRWISKNTMPGMYIYQIVQEGKTLQSGKIFLK